jgi:hypothetical protein
MVVKRAAPRANFELHQRRPPIAPDRVAVTLLQQVRASGLTVTPTTQE